ncbi:MAG: conjugal transfer protein TraW [Simkaniaceae bacterium]|nr:conjugal transfer protein TraW [Simkaniaceae bacterium]
MKHQHIIKLITILLGLYQQTSLNAKNFPSQGHEFPILEENFSNLFQKKLGNIPERQLQYSKELQKNIIKNSKNLSPIPFLQDVQEYHKRSLDPSITTKEDYTDANGNIVVAKGTVINPLDTITLNTGLLFFDGSSQKHIAWAKRQVGDNKWILTNGNPLDLEEIEEREVFFDQRGIYTQKFHIHKIPCKITQESNYLLIEEMPAEDSNS